ncbi:MAG: hypothetical protein M3R61_07430 [Chloroflexota bacterium]|nr:hypothetical protein [Chloroflexota bacterium]
MSKLSNHIPFSRLVDLAEGRLRSGEQIEMRVHLLACPVCTAQIDWLQRVIGLMRADTAEQPPAHVVVAAKRLFRPRARATRQQLMAMLQFDSARTPVALGRRAGAQTERQMLFVVSSYLLDVRVVQHGPLWVVSGQLLGAEDGRQVELDGPPGTAQAMLNDLSEFALPPSPPGIYTLRLQLTDLDITIAGLEVGR